MESDLTSPNNDNSSSDKTMMSVSSIAHPSSKPAPRRFTRQQVPDSILKDPALLAAMSVLPSNYNLEVPKTIWRIKQSGPAVKRVALQLPEGLLMYSLALCDIIEAFSGVEECFVLGDVTYGACCIDDHSAFALGADFLVHYGHSCLVPVDYTRIPCLYVFVDIQIDVKHLVETVELNFWADQRLILSGTIQFVNAVHSGKIVLSEKGFGISVPQSKPLSPGEVLGCTATTLPENTADALIFVSDGRFHLEAFMIANPALPAFLYNPYTKTLTRENYDHSGMRNARRNAIEQAQQAKPAQQTQQAEPAQQANRGQPHWGVILGTLGRQGNPKIMDHIEKRLTSLATPFTIFLISEISPSKIALFENTIDVWVQIACPRLSIDWGEAFHRPLLTPFEAEVALGFVPPWWVKEEKEGDASISVDSTDGVYPMDYYARDGGAWNSVYTQKIQPRKAQPNKPMLQTL